MGTALHSHTQHKIYRYTAMECSTVCFVCLPVYQNRLTAYWTPFFRSLSGRQLVALLWLHTINLAQPTASIYVYRAEQIHSLRTSGAGLYSPCDESSFEALVMFSGIFQFQTKIHRKKQRIVSLSLDDTNDDLFEFSSRFACKKTGTGRKD